MLWNGEILLTREYTVIYLGYCMNIEDFVFSGQPKDLTGPNQVVESNVPEEPNHVSEQNLPETGNEDDSDYLIAQVR